MCVCIAHNPAKSDDSVSYYQSFGNLCIILEFKILCFLFLFSGQAEDYLQQVNRTWAIWIGIGDYSSNAFDLVGYQQASAVVYTDETMPSMTGQPYLESVCYVDKHQQVIFHYPD